MASFITQLILVLVIATSAGQVSADSESHTITNAQFTNWGVWGPFEQCPFGTFAFGYQLKVAPYDPKADNTALNGIRLLCALPAAEIEYVGDVTSSVGSSGTWGPVVNCSGDPLTGFVLEAVPNKGTSLGKLWKSDVDDVAAIAFRGYSARDKICKPGVEDYKDPGGIWAPKVFCDEEFVLCGIRTQVDEIGRASCRERV